LVGSGGMGVSFVLKDFEVWCRLLHQRRIDRHASIASMLITLSLRMNKIHYEICVDVCLSG
jgi:hypothetical protein